MAQMAKTNDSGAARFTTRYTEAQKQAILHAVLIGQMTVAQAIEAAKAGELGVPAFHIGAYAYDIVKKGRDQFEAQHDDALTLAVEAELRGAELDALATIRAIRRTFKRGEANDTTRLAQATRDLAQIRKAHKDTLVQTTPRAKAAPVQTNEPQRANDDTLTTLLNHAPNNTRQGARTGSLGRARTDAA
jgi:hypothetical protein